MVIKSGPKAYFIQNYKGFFVFKLKGGVPVPIKNPDPQQLDKCFGGTGTYDIHLSSVADPDVLGPPGSVSQRYLRIRILLSSSKNEKS